MLEGFVINPYVLGETLRGQHLAKQTFEILHKKFPGYTWLVGVDLDGGILDIRVKDFPNRWGFTEHISRWTEQRILRAGGEVLERWHLSRSRVRRHEVQTLRDNPFRRPDIG